MLTLRVSLPRTAAAVLVAVAGSACGSAVTATAPVATPGATSATVGGIPTSAGVPSRTHDAPVSAPLQDNPGVFGLRDVFELEFAADPRISPDGSRIVYVRTSMDVMTRP